MIDMSQNTTHCHISNNSNLQQNHPVDISVLLLTLLRRDVEAWWIRKIDMSESKTWASSSTKNNSQRLEVWLTLDRPEPVRDNLVNMSEDIIEKRESGNGIDMGSFSSCSLEVKWGRGPPSEPQKPYLPSWEKTRKRDNCKDLKLSTYNRYFVPRV